MTILEADVAATAIIDALTDRLAPIPVGDGEKPDDAGWDGAPSSGTPFQGYVIVYGDGIAGTAGTIDQSKADATLVIQTKSVGRTRAEAGHLRRRARAVLVDPQLDLDGFHISWSSVEASPPVRRDDTHGEALPLFEADDVIHLHVTPA